MKTATAAMVIAGMAVAALVYTLALYPALPEQIPIHWNLRGEIDGWGDKSWAAFLGPGTIALFLVLLFALPWMSPRHFAVDAFRGTFNYLMVIPAALMGYVHVVTLQAALHPGLDAGRWLVSGMFLFLAVFGNVLGKVRRNFWMGVRTPWTLASERVWVATHRLTGRLLVAFGLLGVVALWLGLPLVAAFWGLMAVLLVPVVYSLMVYKQLERRGEA